jgi:hypothetical protein
LTDHMSDVHTPVTRWMHANFLRFGHCAVRYTTSDGTQRVMNILGGKQLSLPNATMVRFLPHPTPRWCAFSPTLEYPSLRPAPTCSTLTPIPSASSFHMRGKFMEVPTQSHIRS